MLFTMQEAPQFYDVIATVLADLVRGTFGPGAVGVVITTVIGIALMIRGWFELARDTGKFAKGIKGLFMRIVNRLRDMPAIRVALIINVTALALSIQALWLSVIWAVTRFLSEIWHVIGYYPVGCAVLLLVSWVAALHAEKYRPTDVLRKTSIAAVLPVVLVSVPAIVALSISTHTRFLIQFSIGVTAFVLTTFAAMFSTWTVRWAWKRHHRSSEGTRMVKEPSTPDH